MDPKKANVLDIWCDRAQHSGLGLLTQKVSLFPKQELLLQCMEGALGQRILVVSHCICGKNLRLRFKLN